MDGRRGRQSFVVSTRKSEPLLSVEDLAEVRDLKKHSLIRKGLLRPQVVDQL